VRPGLNIGPERPDSRPSGPPLAHSPSPDNNTG